MENITVERTRDRLWRHWHRSVRFLREKGRWLKKNMSLAQFIAIVAAFLGLCHLFCYLLPFTDDAFVVTNVTAVAADVSGYITNIYVKNGQPVKKNQPIFKVFQPPYQLAYEQMSAAFHEAQQRIVVLQKNVDKTKSLLLSVEAMLGKAQLEYDLKNKRLVVEAVSFLEVKKLAYDVSTLVNKRNALRQEIDVLNAEITQQRFTVQRLKAQKDLAKINLDLTIVRAPRAGIIDNMYVAPLTPIKIHQPVFSFIDTSHYFIQANFNETDLRNVRPGDHAYIWLRMYYFNKLFHGEVVNTLWAAERQKTSDRSQIQLVRNENEWLLLPQRFPLQIKILDPDPHFPLHPGASAYVYISTRR